MTLKALLTLTEEYFNPIFAFENLVYFYFRNSNVILEAIDKLNIYLTFTLWAYDLIYYDLVDSQMCLDRRNEYPNIYLLKLLAFRGHH